MTKIRTIRERGERWFSEADLKAALADADMVTRAATMLKVAHDKGDDPLEAVRRCLAYFYTEATGAIAHGEN